MKPVRQQDRLGLFNQLDPAAMQAVAQAGLPAGTPSARLALEALDILLLLNEEEKFLPAAMVICNELNARFKATQVSLGWLKNGHVHLKAISNTQKFQKKTEVVRRLQWAMEEAADQNEEIVFPKAPDDNYIFREHEKYASFAVMDSACSLPLRVEGNTVGVITLERSDQPFTQSEVKALRLIGDLSARRLYDLELRHQGPHEKALRATRSTLSTVFGLEHTWTKLAIVAGGLAIAALFLWPWFYRVEANITLKTDTLVHLPAPFDGFIDEVPVRVGDEVDEGDILLSLDRRDLLLQEAESLAKLKRFEAETRSSKAMGRISEGNLANLQYQEEMARLAMVRARLDLSDLRAPFHGLIVEGDLRERIGSPVARGDQLFRVARIDQMHLRLEVDERDIHEISGVAGGEFAFASRPDRKFRFLIDAIEPSAVPKQEGNVFVVRARLVDAPESWWRPGMTGVAKIDVGNRTIFWVLTHRLVDFIRMKLWL